MYQFTMKNKVFLSLLFVFYSTLSNSQFTSVSWTDAFDLSETKILIGNYCNGENKSTLIFADKSSQIEKINVVFADINTNSTKTISHSFKKPIKSIIGGYNKPNSFMVLIETLSENMTGFVYEVQSLELKIDNSGAEEKVISKFNTENKLHFGTSKFSQSPNLKKSLLFIESPFVSGEKESVTMIIYNEKGEEESNNTMSLDLDSKINVHNYPEACNNGGVFFLKKDKEKNVHRYFIYSFNPTIKDFNHKLIALANASITEITGQVTDQNEYLVGGFTASEPVHVYEGYYLFKFDQSCIQKFKTQGQLDEQTFLRFMSKKDFSKDPAIKDFYLDNILTLESGKIFLAAEMYREEPIGKTESWASYKDLMFVCFDAAGKYKTTYNFKKNQTSSMENSKWSSYKTYPNNDTLVIVHNYIVKTEGKKEPEPLFSLVNLHEKYGTKTLSTYKLGTQGDTPFFIPLTVYNPNAKQNLFLFANFDRTKFRLGIFNLTE